MKKMVLFLILVGMLPLAANAFCVRDGHVVLVNIMPTSASHPTTRHTIYIKPDNMDRVFYTTTEDAEMAVFASAAQAGGTPVQMKGDHISCDVMDMGFLISLVINP